MKNLTKLCLVLLFAAAGCEGKSQFASQGGNNPPQKADVLPAQVQVPTVVSTPQVGSGVENVVSEVFEITHQKPQLDMVWVIDNSGSMSQEVAHVRKNIQNFTNVVSSKVKLKTAFISLKGNSGLSVEVPVNENSIQLNVNVGSTNLLAILASAVCDKATTSSSGNTLTLCGQSVSGSVESPNVVATAAGGLSAFFREKSARAYVFVTDDNSRGVTETLFENLVNLTKTNTSVFAFVGESKASNTSNCAIANVGMAYKTLAQKTGGSTFDLCELDWAKHFSKLSENVVAIAQSDYVLSQSASDISSVEIDGVAIDLKHVKKVSDNQIKLDPSIIPANSQTIEVFYKN